MPRVSERPCQSPEAIGPRVRLVIRPAFRVISARPRLRAVERLEAVFIVQVMRS